MVNPVGGSYRISSSYGMRFHPVDKVYKMHTGIDMAASYGTPVLAVSDGVVTKSGNFNNGYGNYIKIDHGGMYTSYAHMSSLAVSEGTTVHEGDVIGYVGSTGKSTGNHLHFEVMDSSGKTMDPASYINGSTVITTNPNMIGTTYSEDDTEGTYTPGDTPYNPSSVAGTRVSEFTSQPIYAYINLYIGDKLLSTEPPKPNVIQSLDLKKVKSADGAIAVSGTIELFDSSWGDIEYYISKNYNNIVLEYGYSGTNISTKHQIIANQYNIEFTNEGEFLHINFTTLTSYQNLTPVNIQTDSFNPTEAIKSICNQLGWDVRDENFEETQDINMDNPFNSTKEYPLQYIYDVILPQARTENGEILTFYTEDEIGEGTTSIVPHLSTVSYKTMNSTDIRTYVYMKGYDSVVKSIDFDINGIFGGEGFNLATEAVTSVFDPTSKESSTVQENIDTIVTEATGEYTHTDPEQSQIAINAAGGTSEQAGNKLYYYLRNWSSQGRYTVNMTVVGDPNIAAIGAVLRLINVTDKGYLHHTSGIYMIKEVHDSISNGEMTSSIKAYRNADINQGVALVNYKELIQ